MRLITLSGDVLITSSSSQIINSAEKLINWVIGYQYRGWDVYDGLNSPSLKEIKNVYLKVFLLQGNKYCPFNIRPFLGVEKGIDLKGMALFAQSYASLYTITGEEKYRSEMQKAVDFIKSNSLIEKFGYNCWASHYFPYINIDKRTLSQETPDIIGTSQAIIALTESYKITNDNEDKLTAINAAAFIIDEMFCEDNNLSFFLYSKFNKGATHITLNASAQAIEALTATFNLEYNQKFQSICENAVETLLKTQNNDGSWDYSIHRDGATKRVQLDFHQGYIIDGLSAYYPYSLKKHSVSEYIKKAANYYQNVLFRQDGRSYYRYPLPYPIDIHNQAQGIISFSKLSNFDAGYITFAEKILLWTINNMQDDEGFFYYQKWPLITNKTPHMRWGQAWMLLAIATYLKRRRLLDD